MAAHQSERLPSGPTVLLLFLLFPCSAELALQEARMLQGISYSQRGSAAAPRTGYCWRNRDSQCSVFEPVLNPAVVAKQPDLMLEMSTSAAPASSSFQSGHCFTTSEARRKKARRAPDPHRVPLPHSTRL